MPISIGTRVRAAKRCAAASAHVRASCLRNRSSRVSYDVRRIYMAKQSLRIAANEASPRSYTKTTPVGLRRASGDVHGTPREMRQRSVDG